MNPILVDGLSVELLVAGILIDPISWQIGSFFGFIPGEIKAQNLIHFATSWS